ncbi:hypothetical protein ACX80D_07385 [Arthrobacter sp. Sr24]
MKSTWDRLNVDIALLAVAFVWGSSYSVAKDLTTVRGVPAVLGWRMPGRAELWTGVLLGLTQATVLFLETFGAAHTQASNAGLVISLTVIFTPLLDSAASRR